MSYSEAQLIDLIERARETRDLRLLADAIPYAKMMGIQLSAEGATIRSRMPFAEHLIGNPLLPALHGGTLGALLEHTAVFELLWDEDIVPIPKIINITVEYLRPGRPLDTYATAIVTKQGRRVANVHARAWQEGEDRPIATANAHLLLRTNT